MGKGHGGIEGGKEIEIGKRGERDKARQVDNGDVFTD